MDLRTQTSLLAAIVATAIAIPILFRPRKSRVHLWFSAFSLSTAAWYLTTFLSRLEDAEGFTVANALFAVALPLSGVGFFRSFLGEDNARVRRLARAGGVIGVGLVVVGLTPLSSHLAYPASLFSFVLVMMTTALSLLAAAANNAASRFERARLQYLTLMGALATTFTLADYLPYFGVDIPPVGTVLTLVFLYVFGQSIQRYRLIDLYELAGRLGVLTAVSFTLAAIFWALVELTGGRFFLHSVVAALAVLLLFDPLRTRVEQRIAQFFFRERFDLEQTIVALRAQLAHVLELDDLARIVMTGLEQSRRVTHASLYLLDPEQRGFNLAGHVGPEPVSRLELAPARPLLDRLSREEVLTLENVEKELDERRADGENRDAETLYEIVQGLSAMHASICVGLLGEGPDVFGLLCIRDERLRDAFTPEEGLLFRGLASQAAIAVENSRLYQRMKERDRLAALGEMAAGIAHEVRNPLGAIKASAQFLAETAADRGQEDASNQAEFLGIIVEEVDRLNGVVSSFLDYARPSQGDPTPTDVNRVIERTMQLLSAECAAADISFTLELAPGLAQARIDAEHLRQVLLNLVQNAVQAMEAGGRLTIATRPNVVATKSDEPFIEIAVADTGPGIEYALLRNLFIPFVTTKERGTGLGLALCQRMVTAAGGHIDVRTRPGEGATFIVRLPGAPHSEHRANPKTASAPPTSPATVADGAEPISS